MHSYRAFELGVRSQVALPDLPLSRQVPDVTIRQRRLSTASLADRHNGGDRVGGLIADGRFRFFVEGGTSITIDYDEDYPGKEMIPTTLLGVVISCLLRQRGLLVLHASCVAKDGVAIGFLGDSGWGKSTLAEHFCQRGYTLLTDDILAIDFSGAAALALPAFPQIKLRPEAGVHLREDYDTLPELFADAGRRVHSATGQFESSARPLAGVFVLENIAAERNELIDLSGPPALIELVRHSRMMHLFTQSEYRRRHLDQCSSLIRQVPIRLLRRRRSLDQLAELSSLVEESVADRPLGHMP